MRLAVFFSGDGEVEERARRAGEAVAEVFSGRVFVRLPPLLRPIPPDARDLFRGAPSAEGLLERLGGDEAGLWVVSEPVVSSGTAVHGLARTHRGAIVSVAQLPTQALVDREAAHEVGHVLGLDHCDNGCVMSLSGSLAEAAAKPLTLCGSCEMKTRN